MYITDYLLKNANELPDKPAVIYKEDVVTWAELADIVVAAANLFYEKLGADEQKIVGVLLPNSLDFLVTYLGIIHAGHIAMPLDPNFKAMEFRAVIDRMTPALIITNDHYNTHLHKDDEAVMVEDITLADLPSIVPDFLRIGEDIQAASMLFTSGTTGNPKAVPYTHTNHMWNPAAVSELWEWTSDDTLLISLPLSHWHGLAMGIDGALYHGNTIYLQTWFDPKDTLEMLESGKISLFQHVPIAYSKLIEYEPSRQYDLSKVRLFTSGSSFLPPKLWQKFKDRFGIEILERYGANEMGLLTSSKLDRRTPGCVGWPLKDVEIKQMESGEIAMKSPGLFPGYWNNDEATAKQRLEDGFWLSGDIGEFDDEGRLWLKGRVQEKMKKFGYTVYPRDVEWAMMQHPDVKETVVMSLQNQEDLNDTFVYFIVGDVTEDEVFAYAKDHMPNFWRPDKVVLLPEIPKTGRTSKPAIKELRAMVEK